MHPIKKLLLSVPMFAFISAGFAQDIRTGLVADWPLEVDNSGITPDVTSFGNDLTEINGPTLGPGKRGNAFTFNGSGQYLGLTHGVSDFVLRGMPVYLSPNGYTIAMWVNGAAQTAHYIFTEGSTTSQNPLLLLQTGNAAASNSKLDMLIRNDSSTTFINHFVSTRVVFDGTWHHIAFVDNRGAVQLYVDGLTDTNFSYVASGTFTFNTTSVGALVRAAVAANFNGSIDEVAAWERPLSQAEVQNVMTNGIALPIPPPVPVVVKAPVSSTNAMGDRVAFTVGAIGGRPLVYQWLKNGVSLADQTNATIVLTDLVLPATNTYSVIVTNSFGLATNFATLVVRADGAPNVSSNLVSDWPLDVVTNSAATNTPDLYSHNDLLLNNMDSNNLVVGQFGNALSFNVNGIQQYANRVGGFPIFNTNSYTISIWVMGTGAGQPDARVYSEGSTASANPLFSIGTDSAGASASASIFLRNDGNTVLINSRKSARAVFDGNWHHLVWVDEKGQAKLYVDGNVDETDFNYTPSGSFTLNTTAVGAILRAAAGNFFTGNIDEVGVWNRRLTYTEIQQVRTTGIPAPLVATPPSITLQPADQTNGIYAGDTVSFAVQAIGTGPLSYQWLRNKVPISSLINPSAISNVLTLANVQVSDSTGYSVVITNVANAITSVVAQLVVLPYTVPTTGDVLDVDFDLIGSPNTQPGFSPITLATSGASFNGVRVTLTPLGGISLADRDRIIAPVVTDNPPVLTQSRLYNDFIFGNSTSGGTGLHILIERLATNLTYGLTVWSFDPQSTGARTSDWNETSSGNPTPIALGYTFNGSTLPAHDYDDTFGALLTSSASGTLQIEGVNLGGSLGVFVNAIRLVARPSIWIITAQNVNGNIRLTVEAQFPGQQISFEENPELIGGTWTAATDGGVIETHGPIVIAEFPIAADHLYYRAVAVVGP